MSHLPPVCKYDKPGQRILPRVVDPEHVADLVRERLSRPEEVTIKQSEYNRLRSIEAQKGANWDDMTSLQTQLNDLALFLRAKYADEITRGDHAQHKTIVGTIIHYLEIERDLMGRGIWGRLKYLLLGL